MRYLQLPHIGRQLALWINLVQPHMPLEQVVVHQLRGKSRVAVMLHPLDLAELLHQPTQTFLGHAHRLRIKITHKTRDKLNEGDLSDSSIECNKKNRQTIRLDLVYLDKFIA